MKILISSILIPALLLLSACQPSSFSPEQPPEQPSHPDEAVYVSGYTDDTGTVTLDAGPYRFEVKIKDSSQNPVPDMLVNVYLLKNYALVYAADPDGNYYPSFTIKTYDELGLSPTQGKPIPAIIPITLTVIGVTLAVYEFATDPPHIDELKMDPWGVSTCAWMDLNDLFTLAGSIATGGSCIIKLTATTSKTVSLVLKGIEGFSTFASLIGLSLNIFDEDRIHVCYKHIYGNPIPIIYIDQIIANRNFWAQFTLTWGENPSDLDAHLWTPEIEGQTYHIYWYYKGAKDTPPYADLDVDDTTSWGPEHITIYRNFPGTYVFAVHHYAGDGLITTSGAVVRIFKPDGDVKILRVPSNEYAESGWWWWVCEINGSTGQINIINQVSPNPPVH
ncbi:MAG: hypothetical protein DRP38_04885 [Thermotogae bacterium]|nr:MAG: hypothetical protein DRP38_04885 [Thermotogota bacterium]